MKSTTTPTGTKNRLWQLEALRGFAAFYVLLHHLSSSYLGLKHSIWGFPFRFGQEGVLIFFLLSGFVICYSHGSRQADARGFRTYLIKRGRRIYPIFVISLLVAYAIQCIGARNFVPMDFRSLIGNLFMLQDHPDKPGVFLLPYKDNMPLWSLSYEWWFYMLFYPINRWVPVDKQKFLVFGLCAFGLVASLFMPNSLLNFLVFFVVWWVGVELAREFQATGNVTLGCQYPMLMILTAPALWYGCFLCQWKTAGKKVSFMEFPFVEFRYFFMAACFILLLFVWKHWRFVGYRQTIGRFERLGAISYALYVFHYPLICDLRLFQGESTFIFYTDLCLRILLALALAWLAEGLLQKWINSTTDPWIMPAKRPCAPPTPVDK